MMPFNLSLMIFAFNFQYPPPLIPPRGEVNAADAFDIGSFDEEDTKGIKVPSSQWWRVALGLLCLAFHVCVCGIPVLQGSGCARNFFRLGKSISAGALGWLPVCCCLPNPRVFRLTEIYFLTRSFM